MLDQTGHRRRGIETVKKRVDIPKDLVFRFEKLPAHFNPATGEPFFGHWSIVLTELLRDYIILKEGELLGSAPQERKSA